MHKQDKIIQIVKGDSQYSIHGISENGNLYYVSADKEGNACWKLVCKSPILAEEEIT